MYTSTNAKSKFNRTNAYLMNDILESSQEKLLLKVYDFAIANCKMQSIEKTNKALTELMMALRFDDENMQEISVGLYKLYDFCKEQMRKRNFELVLKILTDLRESWYDAFQQNIKKAE